MIDFDYLLEEIDDRSSDLMVEIDRLKNEASWAHSEYQDLLAALGATDYKSAIEAIRELKAARSSAGTDLNPEEVGEIILNRIALALSKERDVTRDKAQRHHQLVPEQYWDPTSRTIKTFRDIAGVN